MKTIGFLPLAIVAVALSSEAQASDMQVQLRAFVPTSCTMSFSSNLEQLTADSFSLGTIDQFCNTNYQLTLYHVAAGAGSELRFGDRVAGAESPATILESTGRPVIGSKQLIARGVDQASAQALGQSMVVQVTPLSL